MQEVKDYSSAIRIFLKLVPDYKNITYIQAKNLFDKTLNENVGTYWKDKFIEHIKSFYV